MRPIDGLCLNSTADLTCDLDPRRLAGARPQASSRCMLVVHAGPHRLALHVWIAGQEALAGEGGENDARCAPSNSAACAAAPCPPHAAPRHQRKRFSRLQEHPVESGVAPQAAAGTSVLTPSNGSKRLRALR